MHTREFLFLLKNWLAKSAKAWVSYIRWKSTSSGNAKPYAQQNNKGTYRGGEGWTPTCDLWPVTTACPEGRSLMVKTSHEWIWKVKVMLKNLKQKKWSSEKVYSSSNKYVWIRIWILLLEITHIGQIMTYLYDLYDHQVPFHSHDLYISLFFVRKIY